MKILENIPVKHPFCSFQLKFICRCVKDHSPQEVHFYFKHAKKDCLRHFKYEVFKIKNEKYIKILSNQQCSEQNHGTHCFYLCFHLDFSLSYYNFVGEFLI